MMKKILMFLMIFPCVMAGAQTKLPMLSLGKVQNIHAYLAKYYHPDNEFLDTTCVNTIVYVQFKFNTQSRINFINFSKDCPGELKRAIKVAMMATNSFWKSTAAEKKEFGTKTFLLPVIFHYNAGCSANKKDSVQVAKDGTLTVIRHGAESSMQTALKNMLYFDSGRVTTLDCILLSPIIFSAVN